MTFRLVDSLPAEALKKLQSDDRPETLRHEMLDRGWGACWLKSDSIARLVEDAFLAFDGTRYRLHAWTIMPNHVHVLFSAMSQAPLGNTVGSWKRFTARRANEQLGRTGAFWQTEYWDRFIRNETHFSATNDYIDQNPVKAGLVSEARLWPYGSARLKT
ncbi:MAG: REP-associated tyrosine transposase [Reyranellales bacterium]